ncbi:MAG: hypothetical protein ABW170_22250 [Candidatus Thiodiazotropha sp. L084R]
MPYIAPYRSQLRPYNHAYAYRGLTAFATLSMAVSGGYIEAWFKWIGWLTLTSILFIITYKAPVIFLKIIAGIPTAVSLFMVYFSAIACIESISESFKKRHQKKRLFHRIIIFLLGALAPSAVMYVIILVILSSIE